MSLVGAAVNGCRAQKRLPNIIWLTTYYPQFAFATIQTNFCIMDRWRWCVRSAAVQEFLRRVIMFAHVWLILTHNLSTGSKPDHKRTDLISRFKACWHMN
jgi:hypothetical protein